jgi:G3E family GTPase
MSELDKFPISILSGFLGAGKTTLLKKLLVDPELSGTAVIINEFGEVAIDQHLVREVAPNVVELPNGCLCCALRGDIVASLSELLELRGNGSIQFDRVMIETSGLADPAPVIATITSHHYLESAFRPHSIVVALDGGFSGQRYEDNSEALAQLVVADAIIVTKTDIHQNYVELLSYVAKANPTAEHFDVARLDELTGFLHQRRHRRPSSFSIATPIRQHGQDISSLCLTIPKAISHLDFARSLGMLTMELGDQILRMKGLIKFSDSAHAGAAIHAVQHNLYAPEWFDEWPDQEDGRGRLVVISRGLEPEQILSRLVVIQAQIWVPLRLAA